MTIEIYKNSSEPEKVYKSLTRLDSVSGSIINETSIINPSIRCNIEAVPQGNYAYIPAFGRYYFITDKKPVRENIVDLIMHVDVLYTYRNQISNVNALIERQENSYNPYLQDSMLPISNDTKQLVVKLANSSTFYQSHLLLTINSGAVKED